MDQLLNEIRVAFPDTEINALIVGIPEDASDIGYRVHYSQNEELFLELGAEILIPRFPIHHDVRRNEPSASYAYSLRDVVKQLVAVLPETFRGLTYFFDPAESHKPRFYRLYKVEDAVYLYLLKIDLMYRPFEGEIIEAGTNDVAPAFKTNRLFVESELIPLEAVMWELGRAKAFRVKQLVSNTWIGETGRGYLVHGVWMDDDLSKFFSKLLLPEGVRTYPFYPLFCKYKTVCAEAAFPGPDYRKRILPLLHRTTTFLAPEIDRIQNSLRDQPFSETMPEFSELRRRVPAAWREVLKGITTSVYLNERDMKEFSVELANNSA
ncbi:MAG TPA: hypothetical protein VMC79_08755 [Rectinemataceae bacterium]|nr:hypothetical protein [Rectinemataceae bacterium]